MYRGEARGKVRGKVTCLAEIGIAVAAPSPQTCIRPPLRLRPQADYIALNEL